MTENVISDTIKRLEGIKLDIDFTKEMSEMRYINDINIIYQRTDELNHQTINQEH